jgi:hypothetical protein
MSLRVEVRNPGGMKLGYVRVMDPSWLKRGVVSFVRARDTRYYGVGFVQSGTLESPSHEDLSFQRLDMKVSEWLERPQIGQHGTYRPGRVDFCLIWDGPPDALRAVREFEATR